MELAILVAVILVWFLCMCIIAMLANLTKAVNDYAEAVLKLSSTLLKEDLNARTKR